jgi:membrane dipeptidase
MNRRQFLRYSTFLGMSAVVGSPLFHPGNPKAAQSANVSLEGLRIIDAHAHPDLYLYDSRSFEASSTVKAIKELGMVASSFSAVGDLAVIAQNRAAGTVYHNTKAQLEWYIKSLVKTNKVKLVLKASDVPSATGPDSPPGAILAIEGGDPLEGNPDKVDEFYNYGVRIITLVHYRNNDLGNAMVERGGVGTNPTRNGLSRAGQRVVERMQKIGVIVDVAHADGQTLRGIAEISMKPLLDSHTSPCPSDDRCGRLRTWEDMELIAKTGGVVCTWPLAYKRGTKGRSTFLDWAREIKEMKERLGMDHVGLGTDGGGRLPLFIEGYRDIRDLVHLIRAMEEVGFSRNEIAPYMGGNFYRVFQACTG